MSADEDFTAHHHPHQHFSNIHIDGDSRVQVGNTYYQADDFRTLLDRLSPPAQTARLEQILERSLAGSTDWFLTGKSYLDWRDGHIGSLWCHGVPGAGKTFLTASVIADAAAHHAQHSNVGILYFFCNFQGREQQSISKILASLARQLLEQRASTLSTTNEQQALRRSLAEHLDSGPSRQVPAEQLTRKLRDLLFNSIIKFPKVYLVLDALDEFSAQLEDRIRLLSVFNELKQRIADWVMEECPRDGVSLRLCISSRIDQEAQKALEAPSLIAVRPDPGSIRTFIISILRHSSTLSRYSEDTELYRQIVDDVEKRSDGIFMLAALQMQYLGTLTSTVKIKQALPNLSKRFEDYYKQSLDRIREKTLLQDRIFHLFAWLLHAKATLGIDELRQCLCVDAELDPNTSLDDLDEHVERLAAESEGLVEIGAPIRLPLDPNLRSYTAAGQDRANRQGHLSPLSFAHQTIEAYLRDQQKEWAAASYDPHSFIFMTCARFLALSASAALITRHAASCVTSGTRSGPAEPGFAAWCTSHWGEHFSEHLVGREEVDAALATVADQLTSAAKAIHIDPLFVCVLHNWLFLDGLLIARGANPVAKYHGVSQGMVDWFSMPRVYKPVVPVPFGPGQFGVMEQLSGYHQYAWRASGKWSISASAANFKPAARE